MDKKKIIILVFTLALILLFTSVAGCTQSEPDTIIPEKPEKPTQLIEDVTPEEAFSLIEDNRDNPNFVIIDVRTPQEFAEERIEGAINLDYYADTFEDELNKLDKTKTYVIYCRSGGRSGNALALMEELGFSEVYNVQGGIINWKSAALPTIK